MVRICVVVTIAGLSCVDDPAGGCTISGFSGCVGAAAWPEGGGAVCGCSGTTGGIVAATSGLGAALVGGPAVTASPGFGVPGGGLGAGVCGTVGSATSASGWAGGGGGALVAGGSCGASGGGNRFSTFSSAAPWFIWL